MLMEMLWLLGKNTYIHLRLLTPLPLGDVFKNWNAPRQGRL